MWKYILFRLFRLMCFFLTFIHTYTYVTSVSGRIRLYFHSRCIQYMTHTQFVRGAQQKHSTYCVNLLFCIIYRMWDREYVWEWKRSISFCWLLYALRTHVCLCVLWCWKRNLFSFELERERNAGIYSEFLLILICHLHRNWVFLLLENKQNEDEGGGGKEKKDLNAKRIRQIAIFASHNLWIIILAFTLCDKFPLFSCSHLHEGAQARVAKMYYHMSYILCAFAYLFDVYHIKMVTANHCCFTFLGGCRW